MTHVSKPMATFDTLQDPASWQDEKALKQICAKQLKHGRLVLVLGAGISIKTGLPSWNQLIKRAFRIKNTPLPKSTKHPLALADYLLNRVCNKDEMDLANIVRRALYQGYTVSPKKLASYELLNALGALCMPSFRGNVREVITFNFDDLLETYLAYYGFAGESVSQLPAWDSRADVRIYHPHGILHSDKNKPIQREVLLARAQFEKTNPDLEKFYNKLLNVMQSNTCLFIGLSGDDPEFTKLLKKVYDSHVSRSYGGRAAFWGIRFSDNRKDQLKKDLEDRGVCQQTLRNYDLLPMWLFEVCQIASNRIKVG